MGNLPVFCIMGPTAIGKTDLAVELVRDAAFEIISVDSAMVYRGMDVGTGKPDAQLLRSAPHRLVDIRDPHETYSAAQFAADARREIRSIHADGRLPLLVGGTGLYFRALCEGLAELPTASSELRASYAAHARARGWQALHRRLLDVDPVAGRRIHPNDPQRIQRALEIFDLSGSTMTELLSRGRSCALTNPLHQVIVEPVEREWLHQRIARRFEQMLADGLEDEVTSLRLDARLSAATPAMRSVGYRQVWQYQDGVFARDEMIQRGIIATRQLAKRQLTWLRGVAEAHRFQRAEGGFAVLVARARSFLRAHIE